MMYQCEKCKAKLAVTQMSENVNIVRDYDDNIFHKKCATTYLVNGNIRVMRNSDGKMKLLKEIST